MVVVHGNRVSVWPDENCDSICYTTTRGTFTILINKYDRIFSTCDHVDTGHPVQNPLLSLSSSATRSQRVGVSTSHDPVRCVPALATSAVRPISVP
jgi:hypothetical protein